MANQPYQVEFSIRSSPSILFKFLATPSGLSQWFADDVQAKDDHFVFSWNDFGEEAQLVEIEENEKVKFLWTNNDNEEYFSFEISKSEVTGDTILIITDFADENEVEDQKMLWESQVNTLKRQVGGS